MSGQAGATRQSTYYCITYLSGISVSPAIPPDWDWEKNGDYTSYFFGQENQYFINRLNEVKPKLDDLLRQLRNSNLPIIPYNPQDSNNTIISIHTNYFEQVTLLISVSSALQPENIDEIKVLLKQVFE